MKAAGSTRRKAPTVVPAVRTAPATAAPAFACTIMAGMSAIDALSPLDRLDKLNEAARLEVVDADEGRAVLHLVLGCGV